MLCCFPSRPTGRGLQVLLSHSSLALGGISITNPDSSLLTLEARVAFLDHSYTLRNLSFTLFAILVPKKRMFKLRSYFKLINLARFDEPDPKHCLIYIFYFIFTDYNKQEEPYLQPKHSNNKFKTKQKRMLKSGLIIYMKKFLHSDWLRAVQFLLKTVQKRVKPLLHVETFSRNLCATALRNMFQQALHRVTWLVS